MSCLLTIGLLQSRTMSKLNVVFFNLDDNGYNGQSSTALQEAKYRVRICLPLFFCRAFASQSSNRWCHLLHTLCMCNLSQHASQRNNKAEFQLFSFLASGLTCRLQKYLAVPQMVILMMLLVGSVVSECSECRVLRVFSTCSFRFISVVMPALSLLPVIRTLPATLLPLATIR